MYPILNNASIVSNSKPVEYDSLFENKKNTSHGGEITKLNEYSHFLLPRFPAFSWHNTQTLSQQKNSTNRMMIIQVNSLSGSGIPICCIISICKMC